MAATPEAKIVLTAIRKGEKAFRDFNADISAVGKKAAIVGAAAAGALALVTKASFDSIDALAKTSDKLGIATEALAGLRLAAEQTGIESNKFDMGLQRMTRRIAEIAVTGRGEAAPALKELGIAIDSIAGKSPDEQFRMIADAMSEVDDQGKKVLLGFKLFDAEGVDLIRTLDLGREGLDEYAESARRMGIAVTRIDAAKIEQANNAINLGKQAIRGLGNTIAIEFAPVIEGIVKGFTDIDAESSTLGEHVRKMIDGMAVGAGILADSWHGWRMIIAFVRADFVEAARIIVGAMAWVQEAAIAVGSALKDAFTIDRSEVEEEIARIEARIENTTIASSKRRLTEQLNRLKRLRDEASDAVVTPEQQASLRVMAEDLRETEQAMSDVASELAAAEKPSIALAAWLQQVRLDSEEAARKTAELRANLVGSTEGAGGPVAKTPEEIAAERAAEALKGKTAAELRQITDSLATREESERIAFARRSQLVKSALDQDIITEQRYYSILFDLAESHNAALKAIKEQELIGNTEMTAAQIEAEMLQRTGARELRLQHERETHAQELTLYREALNLKLISEQEFYDLSSEAAESAQRRLTEITQAGLSERQKFEAMSAKQRATTVLDSLTAMTAGIAQHSKAAFRINKLAAIASAVINTAEGVTKALSAYPPPLSFAMAAAQAAAGAVQIQAIKATSFGGGTTPSVAGSTPVINNQPLQTVSPIPRDQGRDQVIVNVTVQGSVNGPGGAEDLLDLIQEGLKDRLENRDEIIFSSHSRQAAVGGY
jgi:hypothetical protein